jgi:hypothetical protein
MRRIVLAVLLPVLIAGGVTGIALATPGSGVSSTPLGQASLDPIKTKAEAGDWEIEIETKGQSNVSVTENRVAPGGDFGWHSHPGPNGSRAVDRRDCSPSHRRVSTKFARTIES